MTTFDIFLIINNGGGAGKGQGRARGVVGCWGNKKEKKIEKRTRKGVDFLIRKQEQTNGPEGEERRKDKKRTF